MHIRHVTFVIRSFLCVWNWDTIEKALSYFEMSSFNVVWVSLYFIWKIVSGYVALWITITNCCTGLPTSSACHIKKAIKCSYPIVIVCLTQLEDGLRKENKSDMGEHQLGHLKKGQGFINQLLRQGFWGRMGQLCCLLSNRLTLTPLFVLCVLCSVW